MSDAGMGQNGFDRNELSAAALIRAAADGELTSEQERRLELLIETDPDLARRVESEQLMRSAVSRAFDSGPAAPADLRNRVAAALAQVSLDETPANSIESKDQPLPTQLASATRDRSFWAGPAARIFAAAAALTLVATVYVVSRGSPSANPEFGSRTRAVQFVASEHGRCIADIAPGAEKFVVTNAMDMPGLTGNVLGREISLADLVENGVQNVSFVDAGRCAVPGGGGSMHLRFEVPSEGGEPETFSLFVQEDQGTLGLDEGVSYELDPSDGGQLELKSPSIYVWVRGGLVYYLVVDNAKACGTIRDRLSAPADIEPLTNAA